MTYEDDARSIREAQERYAKSRDNGELAPLYMAAKRIAAAMICRQCEKRRFSLTAEQVQGKAHDAAAYVAGRFMDDEGFRLKNPAGYIYTCVLRALYGGKAAGEDSLEAAVEELEEETEDGE